MPEKKRNEQLKFSIFKINRSKWNFYKKYHYLTETIPTNAECYELKLNDKKVGFIAIKKFMHPKVKDIMTIARLVILPEFQGFGLGIKFMNQVAKLYPKNRIRIVTSLKPFIISLKKSKDWKCVSFQRNETYQGMKYIGSNNRITASFEFKKEVLNNGQA